MKYVRILLLSALPWFGPLAAWALVTVPPLTGPVIDQAGLLSAEQVSDLSARAQAMLTHLQMQIWIVPSLEGEAIEQLSIRAVDQWKLGDEKKDNGLLFLIAPADKRMRIEVGRGLEGNIPDILAGR